MDKHDKTVEEKEAMQRRIKLQQEIIEGNEKMYLEKIKSLSMTVDKIQNIIILRDSQRRGNG